MSFTQNVARSSGAGFTVGLNSKDFSACSTRSQPGEGDSDGHPTVNALNNGPAIMRVHAGRVFQNDHADGCGDGEDPSDHCGGRTQLTEGVVLTVTPQIAGDGMINMSITPSLPNVSGEATPGL